MKSETISQVEYDKEADKAAKLIAYMKERAAYEKVPWGLENAWIEIHFSMGIRNFFGVDLDDEGDLLGDAQQPAFFKRYKKRALSPR